MKKDWLLRAIPALLSPIEIAYTYMLAICTVWQMQGFDVTKVPLIGLGHSETVNHFWDFFYAIPLVLLIHISYRARRKVENSFQALVTWMFLFIPSLISVIGLLAMPWISYLAFVCAFLGILVWFGVSCAIILLGLLVLRSVILIKDFVAHPPRMILRMRH